MYNCVFIVVLNASELTAKFVLTANYKYVVIKVDSKVSNCRVCSMEQLSLHKYATNLNFPLTFSLQVVIYVYFCQILHI